MLIPLILFIPSLGSFVVSNVVNENDSNQVISQGRIQYQLLRERGNLPKYGNCWKAAIEKVDEGCRELSEETQSDIALTLTNCFLEMSGLETYNCDTDRKENVRRICISSMTDRAFNVYTEFYTHSMNMCWFLRGQIWQETISENTMKVGKQLETSAVKQEKLLQIQKESLQIQEKMLHHGRIIENVLADLSIATQTHQEMLMMMGQTVNNLQSWLVGEVSWVNTLIFYVCFGILIIIITSTPRTIGSRLPILTMWIVNIAAERLICTLILSNSNFKQSAKELYGDIHDCTQFLRYSFILVCFIIIIYKAWLYEDTLTVSKAILDNIHKQTRIIIEKLETSSYSLPDKTFLVYKSNVVHSLDHTNLNSYCREQIDDDSSANSITKAHGLKISESNSFTKSCFSSRDKSTTRKLYNYNLRSNQNTPNISN